MVRAVLVHVRRLWEWLANHPRLSALSSLALACLAARPWGDFPLNDDWQYAFVARRFAASGRFLIDVPVAPALLGQTLLAAPVIRLFGFSHTALRVLTLLMAALALCAIDRILRAAATAPRARAFALVVLALSPFFFYLATTFMTELYGLVPALFAAALWLAAREEGELSWTAALSAGLLCGAAYCTRQFAALVLPALVFATCATQLLSREVATLRREVLRMLASLTLLACIAFAYGAWARATGNVPAAQSDALAQIFKLDRGLWQMQPGIFLVYMTLFALPLLLRFGRVERFWTAALAGLALVAVAFSAHWILYKGGITPFGVRSLRHMRFPYIGEVFHNAGLGPMTLSDEFLADRPSPIAWAPQTWQAIELVLLAATVLWTRAASAFARALRERPRAAEVALFGVAFALLSFVAAVQLEQPWVHDRYYFPCALGLCLSLAAVIEPGRAGPARAALATLAACALAAFTIGGVHDEFRWNEARWHLVDQAIEGGANLRTIDGGYEVDGWLHRMHPGLSPQGCAGACHCKVNNWECADDTNRIGLGRSSGYDIVKEESASSWLGQDPRLVWSRRR